MSKMKPTKEIVRFVSELRMLFPEIPCELRDIVFTYQNNEKACLVVVLSTDSAKESNMILKIFDKTYEYSMKSNEEQFYIDDIINPEQLRRVAIDDFWTWDRPIEINKRNPMNFVRIAINGKFSEKKWFKDVENDLYLLRKQPNFKAKYIKPLPLILLSNNEVGIEPDELLTFDVSNNMKF